MRARLGTAASTQSRGVRALEKAARLSTRSLSKRSLGSGGGGASQPRHPAAASTTVSSFSWARDSEAKLGQHRRVVRASHEAHRRGDAIGVVDRDDVDVPPGLRRHALAGGDELVSALFGLTAELGTNFVDRATEAIGDAAAQEVVRLELLDVAAGRLILVVDDDLAHGSSAGEERRITEPSSPSARSSPRPR
jgi:hypothetical protein